MQLQETLLKLFNKQIEKGDFLTNWYAKDLKNFNDKELKQLYSTCNFFDGEDKEITKLARTVRTRVINEMMRRDKEKRKPKINIKKNKGKRK